MKKYILYILASFLIYSCVEEDYLEIPGVTGMYQGEYRHIYEFPDETLFYKYKDQPSVWEKLSNTIEVIIYKDGTLTLQGKLNDTSWQHIYSGPYEVVNNEYIFENGSIKEGHIKYLMQYTIKPYTYYGHPINGHIWGEYVDALKQ